MSGPRLLLFGFLFAAFVTGLYRYGVPRLEALALSAWHEQVVKRRVEPKEHLAEPAFQLGLYRPELPFHYRTLFAMEDSLESRIAIVSWYQAWGDGKAHDLNRDVLENVTRGGYVPMITWEPWVSAFDAYRGDSPDSSLALVAAGTFDRYIRAWAREAVRFGKPMFLRFAHEFSNPWYSWSAAHGNGPDTFVRAWRRVHGIFAEEGARNVAFVWNPFQAEDTLYYPGDDVVDWVGIDVFNFGPVVENGWWLDFSSLLQAMYRPMSRYGKPIMVAEAGSVAEGGSKREWYRDMFRSLAAGGFPGVKALVVFDNPSSKAPNGLPVDLSMTADSTVYGMVKGSGTLRKLGLPPKHP